MSETSNSSDDVPIGNTSLWSTLVHRGPQFPGPYRPLPDTVHFFYENRPMQLTERTEEIAGYYAKLLGRDLDDVFKRNFFEDWRANMNEIERETIVDFNKCDFSEMSDYLRQPSIFTHDYDKCTIDGNREQTVNYKIPVGLVLGNNRRRGRLIDRIRPEDVIINCSDEGPSPPPGHQWKNVVCKRNVKWLAKWRTSHRIHYMLPHRTAKIHERMMMKKYNDAYKLYEHMMTVFKRTNSNHSNEYTCILYLLKNLPSVESNDKIKSICRLKVRDIRLTNRGNMSIEFRYRYNDGTTRSVIQNILVEGYIYQILRELKKSKGPNDYLFRNTTFQSFMNELQEAIGQHINARTFRVCNASVHMQIWFNNSNRRMLDKRPIARKRWLDAICKEHNWNMGNNINVYLIDPRILFSWCQRNNVNPTRLYTAQQMRLFEWAARTSNNFKWII